jgi:hypothetical protein
MSLLSTYSVCMVLCHVDTLVSITWIFLNVFDIYFEFFFFFNSSPVVVGLVVGKAALKLFFAITSVFHCQHHFTNALYSLIYH